MQQHKYRLVYTVEAKPDGFAKCDVPPGFGACDALILCSLIYPEDGSLSAAFVSTDGRTNKDLDVNEIFKAWSLLATELMDREDLQPGKRNLCMLVHETIKRAILNAKEKADGDQPASDPPGGN
jgi:hypothetical protein